jgi:epoxide hydrolase 4
MFYFQLPGLPESLFKRNNYAKLASALKDSTARTGVFSDEEIGEYIKSWDQAGATTAMLNYYRANIVKRMFGSNEMPPKIDVPTLFIYGEKDKAVLPETVAGVGDMMAGPYTEHRIRTAGHWVQQEARDEVTRVLREFLSD